MCTCVSQSWKRELDVVKMELWAVISCPIWLLATELWHSDYFLVFVFVCLFCFVFQDRVSLYRPGCPGTHSVDQVGLKLRNPPASDSQVLGLKA